ncbi:ferritin-like domain-containing protein [Ramlibacter sp. G-1-2-2]|uniref:Ferritin-like domain-containing protein n=2 Tax=Ramlibacter agri TaxID=2728837 RepID=A0A848H3R2_9BURK|nr:ferritin-like domain-containing protein [Ramlibacter agri]
MTPPDASPRATIAIDALGMDQGAHLLVKRALAEVQPGETLRVDGSGPHWDVPLLAWCRQHGHAAETCSDHVLVTRGPFQQGRWAGAAQAGQASLDAVGALAERAPPVWGLAARGAQVEAGSPGFVFRLDEKTAVWAENAAALYRQALASQWDPETAIDWRQDFVLPEAVEDAVVQVMTYLVENENAALLVPARHLGQVHPHFREVMQLLAIQCADEARHVEVFTRRALLHRANPALSGAGGQASLRTLFDSPDFSTSALLLSVLGEGSFVNLLGFLQAHAPDPVTRQIARLVVRDEARHVAFGMSHLEYRLAREPGYRGALQAAIEQRYDELSTGAGLNEEVFDALVLLAAGGLQASELREGFAKVQLLKREMAQGRRMRLVRLGFEAERAGALAELHTRNFM